MMNESKLLSPCGIAKASALCLLMSAFSVNAVFAAPESDSNIMVVQQGKTLTGVVNDEFGPVAGANIVVKGTTNGTMTDTDGRFSISNVPAGAVLQISFIGYLTQEIQVGNQSTINVMLKEDSQALDEVVVVGYGTMRKSDLTGSISTAKGVDIIKNQSFNALDGLKGKVAGVNIFSNTGQPGGEMRVVIRGVSTINASTSPLYVVDGVVMSDFQLLNPNDIESIEVLKDASSAAIYGARGANGVVLVTTKRGDGGNGVRVSYDGSVSMNGWPLSSKVWKMPTHGRARILRPICLRYLRMNVCSTQTVLLNIIRTGRMKLPVRLFHTTTRLASNVQATVLR